MLTFILEPVVFWGILGVLFIVSILTAFLLFRRDAKYGKITKSLDEASSTKATLEEQIKSLQTEVVKLNNDLAVEKQMYNGLKGQYDELEKDCEKINQKLQEKALIVEKSVPKESISNPDRPKIQETKSDESITNLIQNLQRIQNPSKT